MSDGAQREMKKKLIMTLKGIRDDDDFILGVVSIANSSEMIAAVLDYIRLKNDNNKDVSSDDILALALALRNDADEKKRRFSYSKVAVI